MPLPEPWLQVSECDDVGRGLVAELEREVQPGHHLAGRKAVPIAKCGGCDDAIFRVDDGTWAIVHLTWSRRPEAPPWPRTERIVSFPGLETAMSSHAH
jgi:hypothetical protein